MDHLVNTVLVINGSYEPINVCSVKRAFVLVCKGAAVVQEDSGRRLRTAKMVLTIPSVIRLLKYRAVPKHTKSVSRKGIMVRDSYTCQYCSSQLPAAKLTLDHVHPRSRGGKSTWENLATCCYRCNNKKGDRTPAESGLQLLRQPKQFTLFAKFKLLSQANESWGQYLFH